LKVPKSAVAAAAAAALSVLAAAAPARAFCGFYVEGAGAKLFNEATQVVLMRSGTRTVLSMQNTYRGPLADFALVVPVPVVLQKENVKTLPVAVFDRIDRFTAPRLVEYWEQDPCPSRPWFPGMMKSGGAPSSARMDVADDAVRVEAQFAVGEYDAVVLSSDDSLSLDRWLRENHYTMPAGAAELLGPYVQSGMKFFAAKVDPRRVTMKDGAAVLSPLRFHYDSTEFSLPTRLGLVNSPGVQDLIVHIISTEGRFEVANYPNVFIPSNMDVAEKARDQFSGFYTALFDATLAQNPGAAVTEYAWGPSRCDPCPDVMPQPGDLELLGGDVTTDATDATHDKGGAPGSSMRRMAPRGGSFPQVFTRIHLRYGRDSAGQDLVFRRAGGVSGGRGTPDTSGVLDRMVTPASANTFQGRYVIRHPWEGSALCLTPEWGRWGGPPGRRGKAMEVAADLGHASHQPVELASFLPSTVSEMGVRGSAPPISTRGGGCAGCDVGRGAGSLEALGALGALVGVTAALSRRAGRAGRG
jgi:hypothetical protein